MSPVTMVVDIAQAARADCNTLAADKRRAAAQAGREALAEMLAADGHSRFSRTASGWEYSFAHAEIH